MTPAGLDPLDRIGWLAGQSTEFRAWAARAGQWQIFGPGEFLYHAGDTATGLYGLADGGLEITFPLIAQEPVVVYRAEVGFWIGDSAELSGGGRMVSVMAAMPTRILRLPGPAIRGLLESSPRFWNAFYQLSTINLRNAVTSLAESLSLTVRARTCRRLLALTVDGPEATISQEDLAKLLGVTRSTMRRCISDLVGRGALTTGYRTLRVLDRDVLESFRDEQ